MCYVGTPKVNESHELSLSCHGTVTSVLWQNIIIYVASHDHSSCKNGHHHHTGNNSSPHRLNEPEREIEQTSKKPFNITKSGEEWMETTINLTTQHHIQLRAAKKKVKKLTSQNFEAYFKYLESTYKSKYLKPRIWRGARLPLVEMRTWYSADRYPKSGRRMLRQFYCKASDELLPKVLEIGKLLWEVKSYNQKFERFVALDGRRIVWKKGLGRNWKKRVRCSFNPKDYKCDTAYAVVKKRKDPVFKLKFGTTECFTQQGEYRCKMFVKGKKGYQVVSEIVKHITPKCKKRWEKRRKLMKEQKKKEEKRKREEAVKRKRQKKLEIKRMKSQKLKELSAPIAVMRELPGDSKENKKKSKKGKKKFSTFQIGLACSGGIAGLLVIGCCLWQNKQRFDKEKQEKEDRMQLIKKMGIERSMRNEEIESSDEDSPQPTRYKKKQKNKYIPKKRRLEDKVYR